MYQSTFEQKENKINVMSINNKKYQILQRLLFSVEEQESKYLRCEKIFHNNNADLEDD